MKRADDSILKEGDKRFGESKKGGGGEKVG
jgi:hypothetical protein